MVTKRLAAAIVSGVLLLGGCAGGAPTGLLYTKVTQPYMRDFHQTPVGSKRCILTDQQIKDVVTGSGMSVQWSEAAIRQAAREQGITTINHSDQELFSVLFGVYSRKQLIVYGD
jgi:hypothetical protein